MKILLSAFLGIGTMAAVAAGQSGRRIEKPAPPPAAVETAEDYSESKATPKRPRAFSAEARRNAVERTLNRNKPETVSPNLRPELSVPAIQTEDGEEVTKVETDLIWIPVSVYDRNGLYIPNLSQSSFKIFEDGKEQTISHFGTSEQPFTVVLLIDTSPSTEFEIDEIRDGAVAFVEQLKPQDMVMVIEFDGNVHVLTEPTNNRQAIFKAIKRADFGSGTALYDAVNFSLTKRLNHLKGRKAIVLFTDGVDTYSSKANYDTTLELAEESDALVFPIYYNTFRRNRYDPFGGAAAPGTTAAEYAVGKKYLEELALYTGGRVFRPEATPGGLTAAFEGIAEELRRQYVIGYSPDESGKAGQRKQIKVRVNRQNLVVRARDSYIVGANAKPKTAASDPTPR